MYAVVTLQDSNEVMLAASTWLSLDKTQCYWPPFKSAEKCTEAVKNRLNHLEDERPWDILNITFHGKYDTFELAQKIKEAKERMQRTPGIKQRPIFENPMLKIHSPQLAATSKTSTDGKDEILQILREIKGKVDANSAMLKKLVKDTPVSDQAPSSTSMQPNTMKLNLNLPLRTTEDVRRTERMLSSAKIRKKYVKYLSELGGFGANNVIKKMMQNVLTDDVAKDFNWQGRGGKLAFSRFALADIIKEAAAKQHNITMENCEREIKKYLSYTSDRMTRKKPRDSGELKSKIKLNALHSIICS